MPARVDPWLLAAASAALAPLAACGGLWAARATDPALAHISARLRPSSIGLASVLAPTLALTASPITPAGALVCACLAGGAAADRDQLVLPDVLTVAAVSLSLAFRPFTPFESQLDMMAVGAGLCAVGVVFAAAMHKQHGPLAFGQGDVKLIAGLGVILPLRLIGAAILAGSISALLWALLPARGSKPVIALGLHLVIGAGLVLGIARALPALLGR